MHLPSPSLFFSNHPTMKALFLFTLICLSALTANAQDSVAMRKLVVADIETRVPMRGVIVSTQNGYRDTTNWRGVCYVPTKFDTLTVAKVNYIAERLTDKELKDSTFLIPAGSAISEVTVWGKEGIGDKIKGWAAGLSPNLPDPRTGRLGTIDVANFLDQRGRRDRRHLRKVQEKFSEMDKYDDDPIVNAYMKAMEEERIKKEQEEAEKAANRK